MLKNPNEYQRGKTIVLFVRHGDRIHIPGNKGLGLEIPGPGLNDIGKKQAREIARKLSKYKDEIDALYCSEMTRSIETAKIISKKIKRESKVAKDLSEFGNIVWKRKLHSNKFWKNYLKHLKSMRALDKILGENKGKVVVIVAHGNVIKGLIFRKLGLRLKQIGFFHYHNCSTTLARFYGKKLDHINFYNSKEIILED